MSDTDKTTFLPIYLPIDRKDPMSVIRRKLVALASDATDEELMAQFGHPDDLAISVWLSWIPPLEVSP
jgi:hypothetical protein